MIRAQKALRKHKRFLVKLNGLSLTNQAKNQVELIFCLKKSHLMEMDGIFLVWVSSKLNSGAYSFQIKSETLFKCQTLFM